MPVITFNGKTLTKEQKAQLAQEFTETASKVTGIRKEAFVVLIREYDRENIGVGGVLLADK
ncbi:tautomerase family protein [bacterium]|nr:tautomerase family protein [bacterium]